LRREVDDTPPTKVELPVKGPTKDVALTVASVDTPVTVMPGKVLLIIADKEESHFSPSQVYCVLLNV
tara:strand:- start:1548 stop:1748 length:201 start_codon:yes stop_codon:yes gene_type:complete